MSPATPQPSKEDVLDALAVEQNPGRKTLERYLRAYPQFAAELIDLSRELAREIPEDSTSLSSADQAMIDAAWRRHAEAAAAADPLARLSTPELRDVAKRLDVPRQVITAFRERRVILSTVPRRFLARLAEAVNSSIEILIEALSQPSSGLLRSYKAESKPGGEEAVSFERVLKDAGVSDEKRAQLMSDGD